MHIAHSNYAFLFSDKKKKTKVSIKLKAIKVIFLLVLLLYQPNFFSKTTYNTNFQT